jgi:hypothetical protein
MNSTIRAITVYADQDEWLGDVRPDGIGATDAIKLLDIYPASWGGPWTVWARYHSPESLKPKTGDHLRAGLYWEGAALEWYRSHRLDLDCELWAPLSRIEGGILRPSPDAMIRDAAGDVVGLVEVKCPRFGWHAYEPDQTVIESWGKREPEDLPAPLHYCAQVYLQMAAAHAAGLPVAFCDLVVFFGPQDIRVIRFVHDEEHAADLMGCITEAYGRIVVEGIEPPPDRTGDAWRHLLEKPREEDHEAGEELAALLRTYAAVDAVYKATTDQRDQLRREILTHANDLGARRLLWDESRLTITKRGAMMIKGRT